MPLPWFSTSKWAVIGLSVAALGGLYGLLELQPSPTSSVKARTEAPNVRRGDDPTYADELRTMTALLQDMRYRFDQTENQRLLDRDRTAREVKEATQNAVNQSKQDIDRLTQALRETREQAEQKIKEATAAAQDPRLNREIDRLTRELNEMRAASTGRNGSTNPSGGADNGGRSEANRVLSPPEEKRPAPNDTRPGAPQMAPGMLEGLRQVPGLEGLADRLAGSMGHDPASSANSTRNRRDPPARLTTGLGGDYLTVTPYIAGGGTARALASGHRPAAATLSYQPKRYPFSVKADKDGASAVIPVYTIPDAATLVNNSMMTPLVGRVPFMGRLTDPFRFKLMTGADNLAANGLRIPGVANAVWTGYAVGVREQSCVRAYLDTVTFVFEDGRIHTVHRGKGHGQNGGPVSVNENLGYLTDPWGKPCIRGQFFDNAGSYLKDRGIAAFLDGLANAYANSQVTVDRTAYGLNSYVSGHTYEYALGQGVSGATGEIANYVRERASDAFDVVYVPPGQNVQIFVEAEIPINYDTTGRKLQYAYGEGGDHAPLD